MPRKLSSPSRKPIRFTMEKKKQKLFKHLTCSICFELHSTDNVLCKFCGQAFHRECVITLETCPLCRNSEGFVAPRQYNDMMEILDKGQVRCDYCRLLIECTNPHEHLSKCEKYKSRLLKRILQARSVMLKASELYVPLDPIELNPREYLTTSLIIQIPDLRSKPRNIQMKLRFATAPVPLNYILTIAAAESTIQYLPLNLSLWISDSVDIVPQLIMLPDADTRLNLTIMVKPDDVVKIYLNSL